MKSTLIRTVRISLLAVFLFLSSHSQTVTSAPQPPQRKMDPLLQQAIYTKRVSPDRAVAAVEYYSADKSPIKGAGDVIGILIQSNEDVQSYVRSLGGIVGSRHGNVYTALVPVANVTTLAESPKVQYLEASRKLFSSLNLSLAKTGADVLHQIADPVKKLTGKGIIIGFTDSGINTLHPNFKKANGKTRILYIWDQFASGGSPPAGFTYGVEKDSSAINNGSYTMPDYDYHGTHVSGIAAGNGLPTKQYIGMAPEADIIMVANKGDDLFNRGLTTVGTLDGYDYIRTKANALGKRHVINTSQGTNLGPHDGTTLFEQALNADAAAGSIICLAAGNEGDSYRHASALVTTGSPKEIDCYIGTTGYSIPMDIWYESGDRLQLQIKKSYDATYSMTIPAVDTTVTYTFDVVTVTATTKIGSALNGDNEIYLTFYANSSVNMRLKFSAVSGNNLPDGGRVDLWWERNYYVQFNTNVDQSMTFGIPAGADSAITVASYNNRSSYGSAENISTFSGRGPRRDGKMKPDIAGIGGDVISSVSSSNYTSASGTSMSSPHVAGAVALLLQQDTALTGYQIKEKLKASATVDGFTGAVPNGTWGFGKLNVLKATGYKGFLLTNITPDSVIFGAVFVNKQKSQVLKIKNLGYDDVQITSITPSNPEISVNKTSFTIPARSEESLTVSALPTDTGSFNGTIEIVSSDASSPSLFLTVLGRGDFEPEVTITPDSLSFTVNEGDSADSPITISNSGQGPLTYKIEVDYQVQSSSFHMGMQQAVPQPWGNEFKASSGKNVLTAASLPLLPLVLKDPIDDASGVDVSELRGETKVDSLYIQIVTATHLYPYNFNGVIGLDIDQNTATGIKLPYGLASHDVGCDFYIRISGLYSYSIYLYDSSGYYVANYNALVDTAGKRFTIAIPLNKLKNDDGVVNIAGVFGSGSFSTDYVPNAGHGTIGQQWLVVNPKEGSVPSSGSKQVNIRVRTKDLDGGSFKANLVVASNDPDEATTVIPVSLTVVGNPNLVVTDSIKYPLVYLGFPDTMNVILGNNGTDNLVISGITASDPQLSLLGSTSITIPKNQTRTLKVIFNPSAIGSFSGSLTIASNDPGSPSLSVPVTATTAHPPLISVSPDSLSFTVNEKDSADAQLTINNTGAGALHWSVNKLEGFTGLTKIFTLPSVNSTAQNRDATQSATTAVSLASVTQEFADLKGKRIGMLQYSGGYTIIANDLRTRGARVSYLNYFTSSVLDTLDIIAVDDNISMLASTDITILRTWIQDGGNILVEGDESLTAINALLAGTNITEYPLGNFEGGYFTKITSHQVTDGVDTVTSMSYGSYSQVTEPALVLVHDNNTRPHVAISALGAGRVAVACNEISDDYNFSYNGDTRLFCNNLFDWLAGGGMFVDVEPGSGTIPPGNSQAVMVKVNAGSVDPGWHKTTVALHNNDPLHNPKNVPVSMHVIGKPSIVVVPETLALGVCYVGITRKDSLVVKNEGSDALQVSDITVSDTAIYVDKKTFSVPAHAQQKVLVTFTPHDTGTFSAVMSIASNDSVNLLLQVPVTGRSAYPPVIAVAPDSIVVTIDEGDSTTADLTINNTGKGELHFKIGVDEIPSIMSLANTSSSTGTQTGRATPPPQELMRGNSPKAVSSSSGYTSSSGGTILRQLNLSLGGWTGLHWESNYLWGIRYSAGMLYQINPSNGALVSNVYLRNQPYSVVYDGQYFWISTIGNQIEAYDNTGALKQTISTSVYDLKALAWDGEYLWFCQPFNYNPVLYKIDKSGNIISTCTTNVGHNINGMVWVKNHNNGHLWVMDYSSRNVKQLDVSQGTARVVSQFTLSTSTEAYAITHDGKDLYMLTWGGMLYQIDDGVNEVQWLSANPNSGDVHPNNSTPVTVGINVKGLKGGKDYTSKLYIASNDLLRNPKLVPVKVRVIGKPILGLVPDSLVNLPLYVNVPRKDTLRVQNKGTEVLSVSSITTPDSTVTVNKTSFNVAPESEEKVVVTITPADTGTFGKAITLATNDAKRPTVHFPVKGTVKHPPVFSVSSDTLHFTVGVQDSATQTVTFTNPGKSDLQWETARIYPFTTAAGSALSTESITMSVSPKFSDEVRVPVQKTKMQMNGNTTGIPTAGAYSLQELLSQSTGTLRVLCWTPYGDSMQNAYLASVMNAIKQFRPETQFDTSSTISVSLFTPKLNQADVLIIVAQYMVWDLSSLGSTFASVLTTFVQHGHTLIVTDGSSGGGGTTSLLNATGLLNINVISGWNSFTALVHDNSSPLVEGVASPFYCDYSSNYHSSSNGSKIIKEQNTGSNVVTLRSVGAGFVIYMGMDFYNYNSSMARLLSNAVGLSSSSKFVSTIPEQGMVPAGGSREVAVKCRSTDLAEGKYQYRIEFSSNDPVARTKNILVNLTVQTPHVALQYALNKGLNLISWNIAGSGIDSTKKIFAPVMNSLSSVIGYYGTERFFNPVNQSSSTLKTVDNRHGYWVTMKEAATLNLEGKQLNPQTAIIVMPGYNLVSYIGKYNDTVRSAFRTILSNVEWIMSYSTEPMAFDPKVPNEFNTLKVIKPGSGYWIKMKTSDSLIYPALNAASVKALLAKEETVNAAPVHSREWINVWGDGIKVNSQIVPAGTVITATDEDGIVCGQATFFANGKFGMMPVFKDDSTTQADEGVKKNEMITFTIGRSPISKKLQWKNFGDVVDFNAFLTGVEEGALIPNVFALHQNFPNPFNPTTTIKYDIPKATHVTLDIYNILGKRVMTLVNEEKVPGYYSFTWNAQTSEGPVASGVYFARIRAGEFVKTMKMLLIK